MAPGLVFEVTVKSSVLLLAAWGLTRAMAARSSAAARHVVWVAALAGTLVLPTAVLVLPAWRVTHVSGDWVARAGSALDLTWRGRVRTDGEVWPILPAVSHAPFTSEAARRPPAAPADLAPDPATVGWATAGTLFVARVWAVGAAMGVLTLAFGLCWAMWLVRRARPVTSPEWIASQTEALRATGISTKVRLLVSHGVGVPVVSGLIHPALILPVNAETWDANRRRAVLLHELAHVRRRDCLVQALAHLAWAVQWWNPLAFLAVTRLRTEQERACDDRVLALGTHPTDYASHLCEIARLAQRTFAPAVLATLAVARPSRLETRVTAILDDTRSRRAVSRRFCLAIATIGGLGVSSIGPLSLSGATVTAQTHATLPSTQLSAVAPYALLLPSFASGGMLPRAAAADPTSAVARPVIRPRPPRPELTAEAGQAFLDEFCTSCHGANRQVAKLALDQFVPDRVGENPDVWEKVVRKLRIGLHAMPGVEPPSRTAVDAFSTGLEALLDRASESGWTPDVAQPVTQIELAARLARFLWNSPPDSTLLGLAESGMLREPSMLDREVARLIADRRSDAFLTGFFDEWLSLKRLATVKPDPSLFPEFTESLRAAFQRETALFLASQVREDRPVTELLTAKYAFLNDELARHYGVPNVSGHQFRKVALADDTRAGLLGQGSILTVTSFDQRTSAVVRGKWLLQDVLGSPPLIPPPSVPPLAPVDPEHPVSGRTRLEQHRRNAMCASCHLSMDPLGFALENFDAIGRWRTIDGGETIDASGLLPDGTRFDGPVELRRMLLDRRDAIVSTIAARMLAFALGRPARYTDMPTVRAVVWGVSQADVTWSALIAGIVETAPFQMKRLDE